MMEKAFKKMPREELYERTGVQFMQLNTIFQLLSMLEEDPKAFDKVGTFLMVPDLFNYYLTGRRSVNSPTRPPRSSTILLLMPGMIAS